MSAPIADPLVGFLRRIKREASDAKADSGIAIIVAHPDDETIGIGGHLFRLDGAMIVHVTDGAPRDLVDGKLHGFTNWQDYAVARRREVELALAEAGFSPQALVSLGFADKEAVRHLSGLTLRLASFLSETRPRYLCTHAFEGGHPDHDATAFATCAACDLLRQREGQAPLVIEMPFYHAGTDGPVFQEFCAGPPIPSIAIELANAVYERKRRMLACHWTQRDVLAPFVSRHERFRIAPPYDFRALPNGGRLYYEALPFGFTGLDWLQSARRATAALGLERR
jgi:LmbE family N-acetylglucosaminyl deacetylase